MSTTPIPRSELIYPVGPFTPTLLALHGLLDYLAACDPGDSLTTGNGIQMGRHHLRSIGVWQAADEAGRVPVAYIETKADDLHALVSLHRRQRNVRACSGCDWTPVPLGDSSDPDAVARRHDQFNTHLTNLIIRALVGAE